MNYLKGYNLFADSREFHVYYNNIDRLEPANPVILNGLKVGHVKTIEYQSNTGKIKVTLLIDNPDIVITRQTKAMIASDGLLGSKKIDLLIDPSAEEIRSGDTLIAKISESLEEQINEQLIPLKDKTEKLISSADSVIVAITTLFDEKTIYQLTESVKSARRVINTLGNTIGRIDTLVASEQNRLGRILNNVEDITRNLAANGPILDSTFNNIYGFSERLTEVDIQPTIVRLNNTLNSFNEVIDKVNRGEGTIGQLLQDDSLHESLLETNASLQLLLDDIRLYPNRYLHFSVFGSREKSPRLNSKEERMLKELLDIDKPGRVVRFTDEQIDSLYKKIYGND